MGEGGWEAASTPTPHPTYPPSGTPPLGFSKNPFFGIFGIRADRGGVILAMRPPKGPTVLLSLFSFLCAIFLNFTRVKKHAFFFTCALFFTVYNKAR